MPERADNRLEKLRKKLAVTYNPQVFEKGAAQTTGILAFDDVMNGGFPEGKIVEVFGDFSSGKSLLVYQAIAALQKKGGLGVLVDTEDALNFEWASSLGIDLEKLIYISPITVEEDLTVEYVFKQLLEFVTLMNATTEMADTPAIFAWDSVAATKSAEEGATADYKAEMALRARVMSQLMRKVASCLTGTRVIFILVNQLRDKPGVMYGEKETTPGGRAIKFHAHLRLKMKKGNKIISGKEVLGVAGAFSVEKSKVGKPFRNVNFNLYFDGGIPKFSGLRDLLIREKRVKVLGAGWLEVDGERFKEFSEEIWEKIKDRLGPQAESAAPSEEATETETTEEGEDEA